MRTQDFARLHKTSQDFARLLKTSPHGSGSPKIKKGRFSKGAALKISAVTRVVLQGTAPCVKYVTVLKEQFNWCQTVWITQYP